MVFVLNKQKKPIMPCREDNANRLLSKGKAVVHKVKPFVIRMKADKTYEIAPLTLKIAPGVETTGFTVLREGEDRHDIIMVGEIQHRRGIADTLIKKQAHKRKRDQSKRSRKNSPNKRYKERKEVIKAIYDANLNEIVQSVKRLKKWLPIDEILLRNWGLEDYIGELAKDRAENGTLPERFPIDIQKNDLTKLNADFTDKYKSLFNSTIKIVDEPMEEINNRRQCHHFPDETSFYAAVLAEDKLSQFAVRTTRIDMWISREKGKAAKTKSLKTFGGIGLYDFVKGKQGDTEVSGKCVWIERDGAVTVSRKGKTYKFPGNDITLLQRDSGWDYTSRPF